MNLQDHVIQQIHLSVNVHALCTLEDLSISTIKGDIIKMLIKENIDKKKMVGKNELEDCVRMLINKIHYFSEIFVIFVSFLFIIFFLLYKIIYFYRKRRNIQIHQKKIITSALHPSIWLEIKWCA